MICFYVSKKNSLAIKSKKMDETQNDKKFGNILGYPKCCVNFVKNYNRPPTIRESFNLYSFSKKYNPLVWPCAIVDDANVISHFPCTIKCKKSIILAKKRWNLIKKYSSFKIKNHYVNSLSKYYFIKNNKINIKKKYFKNCISPDYKL